MVLFLSPFPWKKSDHIASNRKEDVGGAQSFCQAVQPHLMTHVWSTAFRLAFKKDPDEMHVTLLDSAYRLRSGCCSCHRHLQTMSYLWVNCAWVLSCDCSRLDMLQPVWKHSVALVRYTSQQEACARHQSFEPNEVVLLCKTIFLAMCQNFGIHPEVDLFASHSQHQLPRYY